MTTFLARMLGSGADQTRPEGGAAATLLGPARPIGQWAYAGVAVASLGGPLALAALYAPSIASGASSSAGLAMVAAAVVFGFPLAIWFGYARHVSSAGGLYSFTEAAAGRRVALAQAGLWALSYLLYIVYTTAQIVYDTLPAVLPGEVRYQTPLEVGIPVVLAGVMIAGRRVALVVLGLLAAGQLALAAALSGVTLANVTTPAGSFGASAPAGSLAIASGQTALLYICGSLPFFLGGELGGDLRHAFRVTRRGLLGAYIATVVVIIAAVAPLAADPALAQGEIPGMAVAERFVGHGFAVTVGIGVAVSVAGVILVEYLALSRLTTAVTAWPLRRVHHRHRRHHGRLRAGAAHQPGPDLRHADHAVAVRAVAQPARHLRRLPAVRRQAGRPGAARLGAGGRCVRPGRLRPVDDDPDLNDLTLLNTP